MLRAGFSRLVESERLFINGVFADGGGYSDDIAANWPVGRAVGSRGSSENARESY